MKKQLLLAVALIGTCITVEAQKPDVARILVHYKFTWLRDTTSRVHPYTENMVFKFDRVERAVPAPKKNRIVIDEKDQPPIIRDLDDDMNVIASPPRTIKTTQREFNKLKDIMQKDPQAFVQAIMASQQAGLPGGDAAKMDHIKVRPGHGLNGPVINNPMELPEKK